MQLAVDFSAYHIMTLKSTSVLVHVTPNFNPNGCFICGYE